MEEIYVHPGSKPRPCTHACDGRRVDRQPIWRVSGYWLSPCLVPNSYTQILLCKKKISHHIEMPAHVQSTKYRWNKKIITQFCCTLRDEHFKPN
jgi:hypothetical protein